jgi:hypothetical protein
MDKDSRKAKHLPVLGVSHRTGGVLKPTDEVSGRRTKRRHAAFAFAISLPLLIPCS